MLKQQNPIRAEDRTLQLGVNDLSLDAWSSICTASVTCDPEPSVQVSLMKFLVGSEVRL